MERRFHSSILAFALLFTCIAPVTGLGQVNKASKTAKPTGDVLTSLPGSDGVVSIDVPRLLNEVLPGVLADDPAKLSNVNARIDQIKARTGIDVRTFDRIAVGVTFVKGATPDSIKVESVALARGRFNAAQMLSAGLLAANSKYKYQQQKYGGKTIYVFNSDDLFGKDDLPQVGVSAETKQSGGKAAEIADNLLQKVMNFKGEIGIVAIDTNTLAIGQLGRVRAAIDASAGKARVNPDLVQLATRNPKAVVGFGANMPANASRFIGLDNDQLTATIDAIRQVYGSVSATGTGYELQAFARAATEAQADEVFKTLDGLRELGAFVTSSMSGDKGKLAQNALANLRIVKEGIDVQIRLELAQADVATLVRVFDKRN